MKLLFYLKFAAIVFTSFILTIFLANQLMAANPNLDTFDLDILYQPRAIPVANNSNLEDIQAAYNSISDKPGNQIMRVP